MKDLKSSLCFMWGTTWKQYGFRASSKTELTVNLIVDELIEAGEKKLISCFVFLDLATGFKHS